MYDELCSKRTCELLTSKVLTQRKVWLLRY